MDEHGIVRLSAVNGNQVYARASHFQLGGAVYGCVRLEIPHIFEIETLAEEMFPDGPRRVDLAGYFFLIVGCGIEAGFQIQTAEIGLSADVVPMGMGDEDGSQLRQIGSIGAQSLVGGLCGICTGSCVYAD